MPRWKSADERFEAFIQRTETCWNWTGSCSDTGYGCFYDGKAHAAHRYSYERSVGPIPPGLVVMHACDNRRCVRPDHLGVGTKADNSGDMARKGRARPSGLKGERHGESKLTESAVVEILTTDESGRSLAARYRVSESAVSLVRRRKSWRHMTDEVIAKRLAQGVLDFGDAS